MILPAPATGEGQPKQPQHSRVVGWGGGLMAGTIPSRLLISSSFDVTTLHSQLQAAGMHGRLPGCAC